MNSDGWRTARLGDVIELQRGFDLPEGQREDGHVPVIASAGLTGTHSTAKVRGPGVVTGRYGTIGRVFFVPTDYWPLNTTLWVKDFKGADPRFIYYWLQTVDFDSVSAKSAVPGVNRNDLHAFPARVPGFREQRRIASVLTALDGKIEHNLRLAERLDVVCEQLFRELLDRSRAEGWDEASVGSVADLNAVSHSARHHPTEIEYIDISGTSPRRIEKTTRYTWPDAPSRARRIVRAGDTLISTVRPERRSLVFVAQGSEGLTASSGFAVLSPRDVSPVLLYRATTSDQAIAHFSSSATGSAYPAVNPSVISAWGIPSPPDRGAAFEDVARPLEDRRWLALAENRRLAAIRDTLLPKLVSGEVCVPDSHDPDDVLGTVAEAAGVVAP